MNRQKIKSQIIGLIEDVQLNDINSSQASEKIIELFIKKERSLSQNSLYWLWLACLEDETGNDKEELHEYFKVKYLGTKFFSLEKYMPNHSANIVVSTKSLDTKQFTDYLDKVKIFASSELGIILPLPEYLHFQEFYEKYGI